MTTMVHVPLRPSWDCACCGRPWPCDPAREHLAATLSRTRLALYAGAHMVEAAGDLPGESPGVLYERFLAWTR